MHDKVSLLLALVLGVGLVLVEHETSDAEGLPSFKGVRTSEYIFGPAGP